MRRASRGLNSVSRFGLFLQGGLRCPTVPACFRLLSEKELLSSLLP
jgi:hypothetical protein